MKKTLRLSLLSLFLAATGYSQSGGHWAKVSGTNVKTAKHAQRNNFPETTNSLKGISKPSNNNYWLLPIALKPKEAKW